jgi:hypothetical protein
VSEDPKSKPSQKLPPPRARAFTLPDDGAIEEARKLSEVLSRPTPGERRSARAPLAPSKPSRPEIRFSMSALELADGNNEDGAEEIEIDFDEPELKLEAESSWAGESDAPERPTEPAPADYASSAHRAVDGTISLGEKLVPSLPNLKQPDSPAAMLDLVALGDYTGALDLAEARLLKNPTDPEALDVREQCQTVLKQMYAARLGSLDRVPVIMVPAEQLRWMSIDQRAAFMLHNIDGMSTLEMILDVSGMPILDAMRILTELVQQRVISLR